MQAMTIRDCYPCRGEGIITTALWKLRCGNCNGTGVSPTWALSDGSDPHKRPPNTAEEIGETT